MKNDYEIRGDVTAIFLDQNEGPRLETIIDTVDLPRAKAFKGRWRAHKNRNGDIYVTGSISESKGQIKTIFLHRWLLRAPKGFVVDHIHHNPLNNRRVNLRIATHAQNSQNRKGAPKSSSSGVRGVYWNKVARRWHARIQINGKRISVGYFDSLEKAKQAVVEARKEFMSFSHEATMENLKKQYPLH